MPRYQFTREDVKKGNRNQPREAKVNAGKLGFERTMETHPFFARHWLKYCKGMKQAKVGVKPIGRE